MTRTIERLPTVVGMSDLLRIQWHPVPGTNGLRAKILSRVGYQVAGLLLVEPDASIDAHVHEHGDHHMYVLDGQCWFAGDLLGVGSYVYVPAGVTHSLAGAGPSACRLLYIASGDAAPVE